QAGGKRVDVANEASRKTARNRRGEPHALDDGDVLSFRKLEVDCERPRHDSGERVSELEEHYESEHNDSDEHTFATEELAICARCCKEQTPKCTLGGMQFFPRDPMLGLVRSQSGGQPDKNERGGGDISGAPRRL